MPSVWTVGTYPEEMPTVAGPGSEPEWGGQFTSDSRDGDTAIAVPAGIQGTGIATTCYYYSIYFSIDFWSWDFYF